MPHPLSKVCPCRYVLLYGKLVLGASRARKHILLFALQPCHGPGIICAQSLGHMGRWRVLTLAYIPASCADQWCTRSWDASTASLAL